MDYPAWCETSAMSTVQPMLSRLSMPALDRSLVQSFPLFRAMAAAELDQIITHATAQSGRKVDEGVLVDFPITRQEIAEVSGTTLHSLSRVLSAWENAGLVVVGRQKVIVRDMERLARIAEGSAAAQRGS